MEALPVLVSDSGPPPVLLMVNVPPAAGAIVTAWLFAPKVSDAASPQLLSITALPAEVAVNALMVSWLPPKSSVAVAPAAGLITTPPLPMLKDNVAPFATVWAALATKAVALVIETIVGVPTMPGPEMVMPGYRPAVGAVMVVEAFESAVVVEDPVVTPSGMTSLAPTFSVPLEIVVIPR